jgi:membrane associated rhomboid family serine protease
MFILWLAISIPTIIAQSYLEKAAGKLTELDNINQISKQDLTKYYKLKKHYIDKTNIGVHTSFDVSGKHNENFNMHIYIALPIFEKATDTLNSNCFAWLGAEYTEQTSNSLPDSTKEKQYQEFAKTSQWNFNKTDFGQFIYLDAVGNNDDSEGFKEAAKKSNKYSVTNNAAIFKSVNEPFESRFGETLPWVFYSVGIGSLAWLILISIPKFDKRELELFEIGKPSREDDLKEFIVFLKPAEGYFVTPILIYINLAVFLIMFFFGLGFISFKTQDLLKWGANFRPATINGEWWRLLTSTFLHGGLMHLLANMSGLLFVGIFLEPILGRAKYLTAYLLTGVLASCASLWWYDATVSVGASGAIFGLYGMFLAFLLTKIFTPEFGKAFLLSTLVFIGFNLLAGLTGGIDNAAHIGGLVSGFILGLIFRLTFKEQPSAE